MKDKEKQFKERIKCGIAYCEDTAVDEIKQDFKMHEERHKQINEMAKIIDDNHGFIVSSVETAQSLYNAGYRKIPEDSVVLSKEEYLQDFNKQFNKGYEKGSKETAREVLDKVYDFGQGFFIERSFMEDDEFNGILDEVKKLFLNVVKIKE